MKQRIRIGRTESRLVRLIQALILAAVLGGCSHSMRMPPDHLHMRPLDNGGPTEAVVVVARLEDPPGPGFSLSHETPIVAANRIALAYRIELPMERGGIEGIGYGAGVWDASTGQRIMAVEVPTPWPEEVSDSASIAGLFPGANLLATLRESRLQFWEISSGRLISTIALSEESPFEYLERTDGGWSSSRTSAANLARLSLLSDGERARAWVPHRSSWITWEIATGTEAAVEQGVPPSAEPLRDCGDVRLTEGMVLRRPSGERPLFRRGEFVTLSLPPQFSGDCALVAIQFRRPLHFLDLNPDVTPDHIRIFNTASGELLGWLQGDHTMQSHGFIPGTPLLLVRHDYQQLALYDVVLGAEVGRREAGWIRSVQFLPDGAVLVVESDDASIIRIIAPAHPSP
jgi:hypothetical protein